LSVGILLVAACGDDPPPPPPQPASASQPAPLPPASSALTSSSGAPSASASASAPLPIGSIEAPVGPRQWADFAGPIVKADIKPGVKAWGVMPVSAGWETLKFTLSDVKRTEENDVVFDVPTSATDTKPVEVFVPTAFTMEAKPADRLDRNDPVMVATSGARAFGRVLSGDTKTSLKVRYRFAGTTEEKDFDPREVVKLDGKLGFGAPVGYSETKDADKGERKVVWHPAQLVQIAEEKAWIVTGSGKPVRLEVSAVKPMGVQSIHRPGDKVWAVRGEELVPGELTEALDDGLRYKVKIEGEEVTVSLEGVTPPLK
jgi:hypothetical protein